MSPQRILMKTFSNPSPVAVACCVLGLLVVDYAPAVLAQAATSAVSQAPSRSVADQAVPQPASPEYRQLQRRLAQGWNTWDVHSVTTHVLLPEGLAIHVGLKNNGTVNGDQFLSDALIGRLEPGAEQVVPGPHTWDGSFTELRVTWKGHTWRVQSARDGADLVLLATPLPSTPIPTLPATIVFSVNFLWNLPGTAIRRANFIETQGASGLVPVYCTCAGPGAQEDRRVQIPVGGPYFAADFTAPVGVSTGKRRTVSEITAAIERQRIAYEHSITLAGKAGPTLSAIQTTMGWDTIYDPAGGRVFSPITRIWSVDWGGYVLADWDTFFASTLASVGDRDLAYANTMEMLHEVTPAGFVPNYARPGGWKSFDRSEPPVGSITALGLYNKFHDRWFLEDAFKPLLRWNRWWAEHRDIQGYLAWGSDGDNQPENLNDGWNGTRAGAILESGLDNSPMYDSATYDPESHLLEYADVGLMSMYIADCDALAQIAETLNKPTEAKELKDRSAHYRARLLTLWDDHAGIFLNKDLHTGKSNLRLSPTNFYPMMAHVATPEQASTMVEKHLLNPDEFWGEWVIPSIERNDPAFHDQDYWRGRIWGPMNYLVYLGLRNYGQPAVRREFAQKSYDLFLKEWAEKGHVHENYNAITGTGDDVTSSDRFYHWGALLGYVEYLEQSQPEK
jgi:hypothetical protein